MSFFKKKASLTAAPTWFPWRGATCWRSKTIRQTWARSNSSRIDHFAGNSTMFVKGLIFFRQRHRYRQRLPEPDRPVDLRPRLPKAGLRHQGGGGQAKEAGPGDAQGEVTRKRFLICCERSFHVQIFPAKRIAQIKKKCRSSTLFYTYLYKRCDFHVIEVFSPKRLMASC